MTGIARAMLAGVLRNRWSNVLVVVPDHVIETDGIERVVLSGGLCLGLAVPVRPSASPAPLAGGVTPKAAAPSGDAA